MGLSEIRWKGRDRVKLLEVRGNCRCFVKAVMDLQFP
jgi:hypothetical protein